MRSKKRLAIIAIGLVACVLAVGIGLFLWRRQEGTLSGSEAAAVRRDRQRLARDYWLPLRIVAPNGAEWFVSISFGKEESRICWRILDGQRTDVGPFAPPEWEFINHQAAALLPDGRLLVAWSGSDGTPGEKIAVATSSEGGFSDPTVIATGVRSRCLDVAVDAEGRGHVLYVSPLKPAESYGPIEGFFPYKCWVVSHDGQIWGTPEPIQGRGRFDIRQAILTLAPSGRLVVSAETHGQFSPEKEYVAYQVLGKSGWSDLQRLPGK